MLASILLPLAITSLLVAKPAPSLAASGGRIGGGSFRTPSLPRSRGYGGSGYRGGGYGGSYRGGGIGFPFILPFFGFGGGGLFGFLILMTITGVIINSIRGTSSSFETNTSYAEKAQSQTPVTIIQIQIGLLAKAKAVQEDLRNIASSSDTSTSQGLQIALQETTLALLRQPELWVYANAESGTVPFSTSESTFNKLSMTERSKLKSEITSNFGGAIKIETTNSELAGEADPTNEYIAVTLLIATKGKTRINDSSNSENLKESLRTLGSISSYELMALEVIWQPEKQGDVLSAEELVTSYPNLKHL